MLRLRVLPRPVGVGGLDTYGDLELESSRHFKA